MYEELNNVVLERLLRRQEKANEKILEELGRILGKIGDLTPSEAYKLGQQLKYGESLDKIIKILSDTSKINEAEIYRMLELEARNNLELKKIYFKAKKKDFIPYSKNIPLQNKVNEIVLATLETYRNISRTTGITFLDRNKKMITRGIKDAYYELVDDAIMNVATGKENFYEAMKSQLHTIGQHGIQSIEYESGYHRRIDSALRMNLSDGLSQLAKAQQEIVGKQFDYDGWEITCHEFPAPDHQYAQGHQFKKEEFEKLQANGVAKDINNVVIDLHLGYETFRPIGELNCYHEARTINIGVDTPRYTQKQLNEIIERNNKGVDYEGKHYNTLYDATQQQRKIELAIRKNREEEVLKRATMKELKGAEKEEAKLDLENILEKQNALYTKYHDFSKVSGLPTKLERTRLLTK